jgi:hypothetical protein
MDRRSLVTWPLVLLAAALSGGTAHEAVSAASVPTRCIAYWHRSADDCRLQEPLRVEALGRDEEGARDLAMERLQVAMEATRDSHSAGAPDIMQAVVLNATRNCDQHLREEAAVTCFPEPHLKTARYCRVLFPTPGCGAGTEYAVAGLPWREGEMAREDLCDGMDRDLDFLAEDPRAVKACEARCWQETRVECGLQ